MWKNFGVALHIAAVMTQAGCAAESSGLRSMTPQPASSTELRREQLGVGVSLLTSLDERVAGLAVMRGGATCPVVSLRGSRALDQPAVYVNGSRVRDTCVLDLIAATEVERVRVFRGPAGPSAPGFVATPAGLIVVETRGR